MTARPRAWILLVCLLSGAGTLRAQDVPSPSGGDSPEAVARDFFDALESYRWSEAAAHVDEDSLAIWRGRIVKALTATPAIPSRPRGSGEADSLPSMEEFFELLLSRRIAMMFAGIETLEELKGFTDAEAAARALEADSPEGRLHAAMEMVEAMAPGEAASAEAGPEIAAEVAGQMPPSAERVVVGALSGPGDAVYVVYRLLWDGMGEEVTILPMVRTAEGWRVIPRAHRPATRAAPAPAVRTPHAVRMDDQPGDEFAVRVWARTQEAREILL